MKRWFASLPASRRVVLVVGGAMVVALPVMAVVTPPQNKFATDTSQGVGAETVVSGASGATLGAQSVDRRGVAPGKSPAIHIAGSKPATSAVANAAGEGGAVSPRPSVGPGFPSVTPTTTPVPPTPTPPVPEYYFSVSDMQRIVANATLMEVRYTITVGRRYGYIGDPVFSYSNPQPQWCSGETFKHTGTDTYVWSCPLADVDVHHSYWIRFSATDGSLVRYGDYPVNYN